MSKKSVFIIDLDSRKPEVLELCGSELEFDLDFFGVTNALDLETYERRVFETEEEAEIFLETYNRKLKSLSNSEICLSRKLPSILYKRRFIVLSLLGLKNQTYRHYKKNWRPGDLVNLHDQTFFLTVKIKSITETEQGYKYAFELP